MVMCNGAIRSGSVIVALQTSGQSYRYSWVSRATVLGTTLEGNRVSGACTATSSFSAARMGMGGKGTPVLEICGPTFGHQPSFYAINV